VSRYHDRILFTVFKGEVLFNCRQVPLHLYFYRLYMSVIFFGLLGGVHYLGIDDNVFVGFDNLLLNADLALPL
jgi:hypothetical protein